jgi:hypothetical protein
MQRNHTVVITSNAVLMEWTAQYNTSHTDFVAIIGLLFLKKRPTFESLYHNL